MTNTTMAPMTPEEALNASLVSTGLSAEECTRLTQRQFELEKRMIDKGVSRFRENLTKNISKHRESSSGSGHQLLVESIMPVAEGFKAFIQEAHKAKRGRKHLATKIFEELGSDECALITAKAIIDHISANMSAMRMALKIAGMMLDELKYRKFRQEAPQLFDWKLRNFNTSSYVHMKRSLDASMTFANIDTSEYALAENHRLLLGVKALDIFVKTTGYVSIERTARAKMRETNVIATQDTMDWIQKCDGYLEFLTPIYCPSVIPPRPWSNTKNGAYWFALAGKFDLMRTFDGRNQLADLDNVDMPIVYTSINALQDTSWAVNKQVFAVMENLTRNGNANAGLPSYTDEALPVKPVDIDTDENSRKRWRKAAHGVHERNHARKCRAIGFSKTLATARLMMNERNENGDSVNFYFPYNLDFRGRAYAIPLYLQPQGDDIQKGLLCFGDGKRLGTLGAAAWLAIHGANCLADAPSGEKLDKLPMQDRVDWIYNHNEDIKGVADDPYTNDWWTKADSPFCFLAFCFEWAGYLREGTDFVSHLPVAMDGSCNGLQHYSALLRDEDGGKAVNLVPSDIPQDIYRTVANKVNEILERNAFAPAIDGVNLALDWLTWGKVNRSFVKRQVMTLPYGSKKFGFRDQIQEFVKALDQDEQPAFMVDSKDGGFSHYNYMASIIWDALSGIVVAACEGMEFFQRTARLCVKENLPISWTAPNGLPIVQSYPEEMMLRVKTTLDSISYKPAFRVATKTLDRHKQMSGIAPNVIHSLDAAAMMLTVVAAKEQGIKHFAMIHDSFGTLAADAATLAQVTRRAFVDMYTKTDVLGDLQRDMLSTVDIMDPDIEIPELPLLGNLNLDSVMQSQYFFA